MMQTLAPPSVDRMTEFASPNILYRFLGGDTVVDEKRAKLIEGTQYLKELAVAASREMAIKGKENRLDSDTLMFAMVSDYFTKDPEILDLLDKMSKELKANNAIPIIEYSAAVEMATLFSEHLSSNVNEKVDVFLTAFMIVSTIATLILCAPLGMGFAAAAGSIAKHQGGKIAVRSVSIYFKTGVKKFLARMSAVGMKSVSAIGTSADLSIGVIHMAQGYKKIKDGEQLRPPRKLVKKLAEMIENGKSTANAALPGLPAYAVHPSIMIGLNLVQFDRTKANDFSFPIEFSKLLRGQRVSIALAPNSERMFLSLLARVGQHVMDATDTPNLLPSLLLLSRIAWLGAQSRLKFVRYGKDGVKLDMDASGKLTDLGQVQQAAWLERLSKDLKLKEGFFYIGQTIASVSTWALRGATAVGSVNEGR